MAGVPTGFAEENVMFDMRALDNDARVPALLARSVFF